MKIELIEDNEAFLGLRSDWDALLDRSPQYSVFLTWEWLYSWWAHFQEHKQLFILLVRDDASSQIQAIAPWYIEEQNPFHFLPLRKISFLGTGRVTSDFLNLIISPGLEEPALECLCQYLQTQARRWDVIEFRAIREDSATLDYLRRITPPQVRVLERTTDVCPYIPLPSDHAIFLSALSSNLRQNLRTYTRAVEVKHRMRYTLATDPEQLKQNIDSVFDLHNERFSAKVSEPATRSNFSGQPMRDFHYDVAARFLAKGWLKLFFLEYNLKPVACLYAFQYKGRAFVYQTGFSCAWEKSGLGNVMYHYAIRDCIQAGLQEFHFLRGGEAYKAKWTNTARLLHTVVWINSSRKGRMYLLYLKSKAKMKTLLFKLGFRRTAPAPYFGSSPTPVSE